MLRCSCASPLYRPAILAQIKQARAQVQDADAVLDVNENDLLERVARKNCIIDIGSAVTGKSTLLRQLAVILMVNFIHYSLRKFHLKRLIY